MLAILATLAILAFLAVRVSLVEHNHALSYHMPWSMSFEVPLRILDHHDQVYGFTHWLVVSLRG